MSAARYFYLRDHAGHPVGVVAMRREQERVETPDPEGGKPYVHTRAVVRVAMSVCAPVDRFDRRIGVARAVGRLDSPRQSTTARTLVAAWCALFRHHEPEGLDWRLACDTFSAQRSRLLRDVPIAVAIQNTSPE